MKGFREDKTWTDPFLPKVKMILGGLLFEEADDFEDQHHNTDIILQCRDTLRVAVRIRREEWLAQSMQDFTLRYRRPSGVKTEYQKILAGWGTHFFYAVGRDSGPPMLLMWRLISLDAIRDWLRFHDEASTPPGRIIGNLDGSSQFLAIRWEDLPYGSIIGQRSIAA